jgi:hypothetical protein
MKKIFGLFLIALSGVINAQNNPNPGYWQQQADYKMEVWMDVKSFQYTGTQILEYTNNSNDTLKKVLSFIS